MLSTLFRYRKVIAIVSLLPMLGLIVLSFFVDDAASARSMLSLGCVGSLFAVANLIIAATMKSAGNR